MEIRLSPSNVIYHLNDIDNVFREGTYGSLYKIKEQNGDNYKICKEIKTAWKEKFSSMERHCVELSKLTCPFLAPVYCAVTIETSLYVPMDYYAEGNLDTFVVKKRPKLLVQLELMSSCVQGLMYLHTREPPIVHGQITPSNVFVGRVEGGYRACLADPGFTQTLDPTHQ